jgi:hypothetical protein
MTRPTGWRAGYLAAAPDLFHWSSNKTCLRFIGRAGYPHHDSNWSNRSTIAHSWSGVGAQAGIRSGNL